jgi:hypothetical protein
MDRVVSLLPSVGVMSCTIPNANDASQRVGIVQDGYGSILSKKGLRSLPNRDSGG